MNPVPGILAENPLDVFQLKRGSPRLPPEVKVNDLNPLWVTFALIFFEPGLFLKYRGMLYLVSVQLEIQDKLA